MKAIRAIYQNRAFWPLDPVDLPDGCLVELEVRILDAGQVTNAEKDLLDQANTNFQKDPDKGRPWSEVSDEIRGKLRQWPADS